MKPKKGSNRTKNSKPLVGIFAHPDDESFGPGGTLAKFAKVRDVHVLCATGGEAGGPEGVHKKRKHELAKSSEILGIKSTKFLGFIDGNLCNAKYHALANKIEKELIKLKPDTIMTFEPRGVSGHIDHITVSMVTSFVFMKLPFVKTLLYYCVDEKGSKLMSDYFIYFPPGYKKDRIDKVVDISKFWDTKQKAMFAHDSQSADAKKIISRIKKLPKEEYFLVLKKH